MFRSLIFVLIIISAFIGGEKNLHGAPAFIPGINGLPLMEGLVIVPDSHVIFETLNGRIIEIFAIGEPSFLDISSFYSATLQQLGWSKKSKNVFQRDEDLLRIEISDDKMGQSRVRFFITPRSE